MNSKGADGREVAGRLEMILRRRELPSPGNYQKTLEDGIDTLKHEAVRTRPVARSGRPGGLVRLKPGGYYVIVPDLHGRMDFFMEVMNWTGFSGRPVITDMADGYAQVVCVGDAFHSEARGRNRWTRAMQEWTGGYKKHRNMDREMQENLGILEMIAVVKTSFPERFHFLKGNHENIANELGEGNFPFRKFANEGDMVKLWVDMFMGESIFNTIYQWEKALPLMAEGPDFLVTHCEPGKPVGPEEVINAYDNTDIIYQLTWTDNGQARPGSAAESLNLFGKSPEYGRIFGGHRPVNGLYSERQGGRYIQINRPDIMVIAAFTDMQVFNPVRDIICLNKGDGDGEDS